MNEELLDIRNHKIIEKVGLAKAFNELCGYLGWETLYEWQGTMSDEYDIEL